MRATLSTGTGFAAGFTTFTGAAASVRWGSRRCTSWRPNGRPPLDWMACCCLANATGAGGGCGLGDDGASLDGGWRLDWRCGGSAQNTPPLGHDAQIGGDLGLCHLPFVHFDDVSINRLAGGESCLRGRGHARRGLVHIFDIPNVGIVCRIAVINVCNMGIVDRCVRHVNVCHVGSTHTVGRNIDLTRSKRKPRHARAAANADAEVGSTHPCDERQRIDWACDDDRSRAPAPRSANIGPAALMEWSEAPGRLIHPRPAPRPNPDPMAITIRSPADDN